MKFLNISVFLVAFFVSGCSTSPIRFNASNPVPKQSTFLAYSKYSTPNDSGSKIIIVRDRGIFGSALPATLFLDGEMVASLGVSESVVLHVGLEEYLIGVASIAELSSESEPAEMVEYSLHVAPNKTYGYRIKVKGGEGVVLQRSSQL